MQSCSVSDGPSRSCHSYRGTQCYQCDGCQPPYLNGPHGKSEMFSLQSASDGASHYVLRNDEMPPNWINELTRHISQNDIVIDMGWSTFSV